MSYIDVNLEASSVGTRSLVYDAEALHNRLYTLFTTSIGTRVFLRDYGTNLLSLLFEPLTLFTADLIQHEIYTAVSRWEPDLIMRYEDVVVTIDEATASYNVALRGIDPTLGDTPLTFNFKHGGAL